MPDPRPDTLDEATVRGALTEQFDACNACRACVALCGVFPLMFDLIHGSGAPADEPRAAGDLTVADQDRIVDACVRCGACVEACPYGNDVPALADRALAMRRKTGQLPLRRAFVLRWRELVGRRRAG